MQRATSFFERTTIELQQFSIQHTSSFGFAMFYERVCFTTVEFFCPTNFSISQITTKSLKQLFWAQRLNSSDTATNIFREIADLTGSKFYLSQRSKNISTLLFCVLTISSLFRLVLILDQCKVCLMKKA